MTDSEFRALEGDPSLLSTKASHYAEIANAISRSVNTLNSINSVEGMTSKAIDAIREEAGKVAADIGKAKDRYAGTASALITYAAQLSLAQEAANVAISRIGDKEDAASEARAAKTASGEKNYALIAYLDPERPGRIDNAESAAAKADAAVDSANADLAAAQAEWHSALEVKNQAAEVAITAILEVVEGGKSKDLNDGWWDDWGAKALDILKTICEVAGVLAIFLAWIPGLGAILLVLATIGAVIALVEATIKAVNGDGSWANVAFAAVGVVLTVFGGNIGKYLGKLVKAKGLTAAMKLPRKQFTALTGITKGNKGKQLADVQHLLGSPKKLPGAMKDIFGTNPFKIAEKDFGRAYLNFRRNPLNLAGFDNPAFSKTIADQIPIGSKVALTVWNYRGVASKMETFTNNPFDTTDRGLSFKPESILKDIANGEIPRGLVADPIRLDR